MCGITGHINFSSKNQLEDSILKEMVSSMVHRGPDDSGLYINDKSQIGMRRLSIIDAHNGAQPIISDDNMVIIIMNGEIFNYQSLKDNLIKGGESFKTNSDTEVLLKLYIRYGKKCIEMIDGMFAFCIIDHRDNSAWLVRDRSGIKPLYYFTSNQSIVFGSTLDAVIKSKLVTSTISQDSIDLYLVLSYVPTPRTIYESIYKLEPGHEINIDADKITINKYWNINHANSSSKDNYAITINKLLNSSIKKHAVSDQPVGTFLSGGIDSSLITYKYKDISSKFRCFTADFKDKDQSDSVYASKVSQSLGIEHSRKDMSHIDHLGLLDELMAYIDEPVYDSSMLPTYALSKIAKQENISVLLAGNGADEVFGGYKRHYARLINFLRGRLSWLSISVIKIFSKYFHKIIQLKFQYIGYAIVYSGNNLNILSTMSNSKLKNIEHNLKQYFTRNIKPAKQKFKNQMKLIDFNCYLLDNGLSILDKCTMAASIEGRVPYLDHKILEYAFNENNAENQKENYATSKQVLRDIIENSEISYLAKRNKLGFNMPINEILENDKNKEIIKETIESAKSKLEKYINYPLYLKMIIDNKPCFSENILSIYVLSKWLATRNIK
ncbi:asparagine synthase (glutamine-hydrolyzing) [Gammaproteobacteria bacterium]|nr:asparagine synthase (glutamine-hydrolyzing) [Gammaproteobacteria bacterium]